MRTSVVLVVVLVVAAVAAAAPVYALSSNPWARRTLDDDYSLRVRYFDEDALGARGFKVQDMLQARSFDALQAREPEHKLRRRTPGADQKSGHPGGDSRPQLVVTTEGAHGSGKQTPISPLPDRMREGPLGSPVSPLTAGGHNSGGGFDPNRRAGNAASSTPVDLTSLGGGFDPKKNAAKPNMQGLTRSNAVRWKKPGGGKKL